MHTVWVRAETRGASPEEGTLVQTQGLMSLWQKFTVKLKQLVYVIRSEYFNSAKTQFIDPN